MQKISGRYVKANALVNAAYKLSVAEQRVLIMALMGADSRNITDQQLYRVTAADLQRYTGTTMQSSLETLKAAAEKLKQREVVFYEKDNGASRGQIVRASWVQTIRYEEGEAALNLRFNKDMLPYINRLTKRFTIVYLMEGPDNFTLEFDSNYSYRLLELMSQWLDRGWFDISVQELRLMFALTTQYKMIAQLKIKVLDVALREVNAKTEWVVNYENLTQGRRITGFRFKFKAPASVMKRRRQDKKLPVTDAEIHKHAKAGETYEQVKARLIKVKQEIEELKKEYNHVRPDEH